MIPRVDFQFTPPSSNSEAPLPVKGRAHLATLDPAELHLKCFEIMEELYSRAQKGDDNSADYLQWIGFDFVDTLQELTKFETGKKLAESSPQWPTRYGLNPDSVHAANSFLKGIKLGAKSKICATPAARWSRNSVATRWAFAIRNNLVAASQHYKMNALLNMVDGLKGEPPTHVDDWFKQASELPALSKDTAGQWSSLGIMAIERYPEILERCRQDFLEAHGPEGKRTFKQKIRQAMRAITAKV